MPTPTDIANALTHLRESFCSPRPLRPVAQYDWSVRPPLGEVIHRYARGRCLDFAVRLAEVTDLVPVALYTDGGSALSHAFLVRSDDIVGQRLTSDSALICIDASGVWSLAEMKKMARHVDGAAGRLRLIDLARTLSEIAENERDGADFDPSEVVLAVAGCLPHLQGFVPESWAVPDADAALERLGAIVTSKFASTGIPGPSIAPGRP